MQQNTAPWNVFRLLCSLENGRQAPNSDHMTGGMLYWIYA